MAYIQFKLDAEINKTLIVQKTIQVISTSTSEYKLGAKSLGLCEQSCKPKCHHKREPYNPKLEKQKTPIWYILNTTQTNRR